MLYSLYEKSFVLLRWLVYCGFEDLISYGVLLFVYLPSMNLLHVLLGPAFC